MPNLFLKKSAKNSAQSRIRRYRLGKKSCEHPKKDIRGTISFDSFTSTLSVTSYESIWFWSLDESQTQSRSFQIKLDFKTLFNNGWYYSIFIG